MQATVIHVLMVTIMIVCQTGVCQIAQLSILTAFRAQQQQSAKAVSWALHWLQMVKPVMLHAATLIVILVRTALNAKLAMPAID